MTTDTIHPIILSGGFGTRLWPASRKAYPKQFAPLLGEHSLYQETLRRLSGEGFAAPLVMTGEAFRFMAVEQAEAVGLIDADVVVEPAARDTAPAILAAALRLAERAGDDALMFVAPSDHAIADKDAFLAAVRTGAAAAGDGTLVTFGVVPDRPETGYGYLELSARPEGATPVTNFREKPDLETVETFLAEGRYLWNAGFFLGRVGDFIAAFEAHAPDLMEPVRAAVAGAETDIGFTRLDATSFEAARAVSLDYSVMEKAEKIAAVPLDCGWSDLGAWDALWQIAEKDETGTAATGSALPLDCTDSYLRAEDGIRLVGLGLDNMVAIAMRDAVLVAPKDRAQDVKRVVETLRASGSGQADDYPRFHRPWGWYETLCLGDRFQVKRIMVKPGGVLSLQSHMHRSEHWVVVAGTAEVTVGEDVKLITENESVYIPLGTVHRMANRGQLPMYLIEVQTGSYLGEDDIVRYEDIYKRN